MESCQFFSVMHNQVKLGAVFTTTHPVTRRAFLNPHSPTKKRPALWAGAPWLAQNPEAIPLIGTSVRAVTLAMAAKSIADLAPRDAVVTAGILKTASVTADHQDSATNIASGMVRIEFVECDSRSVAVAIETSKTGVGNRAASQHRSVSLARRPLRGAESSAGILIQPARL